MRILFKYGNQISNHTMNFPIDNLKKSGQTDEFQNYVHIPQYTKEIVLHTCKS